MGIQNGSSPPKEINIEMHSISTPGYTRDDVTDNNSKCGMVSEITTITRAVDLGPNSVEQAGVTKIEYFGIYLRYLLTNPTSPHCDNFPANPRSYPVGPQIPVTPNIAELVCFFPETL